MDIKQLFKKFLAMVLPSGRVDYVCGSEALPMPYAPDEEAKLLAEMENGNTDAGQSLIEHNLRLVVYIARRFENTGVDLEDLVSVGTIGLIKAVRSFNSDRKIKLATYASRCIENEILMHLRRTSKLKGEVSFDEPLNVDWDGNELLLSDVIGTDSDFVFKDIESTVERELLYEALRHLSERERRIMSLRFGLSGGDELTQKEVADLLGISQSYISRLEKKIVTRLKKEFSQML